MFKRTLLAVSMAASLAVFSPITQARIQAVTQPTPSKPNIVILLADDMGYDLGVYGHPTNKTPILDNLANTGQKWNDFYVASGVCSPSRGALLTGRYPIRTGLYGVHSFISVESDPYGFPESEISLAELLQKNGYKTGIVGKWHLGDSPKGYPTNHGFDYWYGIPLSNDAYKTYTLDLVQSEQAKIRGDTEAIKERGRLVNHANNNPEQKYWNSPVYEGYANSPLKVVEQPIIQKNFTKNIVSKSIAFIKKNKEKPFFLYVPFSNPHVPLFPSDEFRGTTNGGAYGDSIAELDYSVGQILAELDRDNLRENTIIIFLSDNGPWLQYKFNSGSSGFFENGKGSTYEGGVRVPAIFNWKGHIKSATIYDIGSSLDIFPTIANLTGAKLATDRAYDGFDISNTLLKGEKSKRDFNAYFFEGELKAFRKGDYKLHFDTVNFIDPKPFEKNNIRLFNVAIDTRERWDIADQNPERVAKLKAEAIAYDKSVRRAKEPLFDKYIFEVIESQKTKVK